MTLNGTIRPMSIPIYTIGYGQRTVETFINLLQTHQIDYLIDVRSQPFSRFQPDFNRPALDAALRQANIRYVFMGDALGGRPTDPNCLTNGKVDDAKVREMPFFKAGIGRLQNAFQQQQRVALMCSEAKPERCHRSRLIGHALADLDIPVQHIDEAGELQSQTAVSARQPAEQLDLEVEETSEPKTAVSLLQRVFGYDSFRPLQKEIIDTILAGSDALVIMPTGGGKSLCYQLPALLLDGLTLVVSPLIALMEDQVMQLRQLGVAADFLNSSLDPFSYSQIMTQVRLGETKLLYVAPETALRPETLALLDESHVRCIAIDEAHCVSAWGHDFRPEYRRLAELRERFARATWVALTATATERVQNDIRQTLGLTGKASFIGSFDRPNLYLAAEAKEKLFPQVTGFLAQREKQCGIIYCSTRKQVDRLTEKLNKVGYAALPYHAGLDAATRRDNQTAFVRDDVPIMVATIAFGMGINKPDVRFVLHTALPKSVESYYQQIGRAGRDGLRADCLLLYSFGDVSQQQFHIGQGASEEQMGRRARLEALADFAASTRCRRQQLLAYFGEAAPEQCELCDNCLAAKAGAQQEQTDISELAQKFLSCVYRTRERFGQSHVIKVLRGSEAKSVLKFQHDTLTTYGIGADLSERQWKEIVRQLIDQRLLSRDLAHGSLKITEAGWAALRGETAVFGHVPPAKASRSHAAPSVTVAEYDLTLFNTLRDRRKSLADAQGLPPYAVFHDRTLIEMATFFPQTRAQFLEMYGVGETKLEKYADEFLPLIADHCEAHGLVARPRGGGVAMPTPESLAERFAAGESLDDIVASLRLTREWVISQLHRFVSKGGRLDEAQVRATTTLTESEIAEALAAFAADEKGYTRAVFDWFNGRLPYEELLLVRVLFLQAGEGAE